MFIKKNGKIYKEVDVNTLTKEELIDIIKLVEETPTYSCGFTTTPSIKNPYFYGDPQKPSYTTYCSNGVNC